MMQHVVNWQVGGYLTYCQLIHCYWRRNPDIVEISQCSWSVGEIEVKWIRLGCCLAR
jgi:hypothetical protein